MESIPGMPKSPLEQIDWKLVPLSSAAKKMTEEGSGSCSGIFTSDEDIARAMGLPSEVALHEVPIEADVDIEKLLEDCERGWKSPRT